MLADRDHQLGEIIARADDARAGRGAMVFVSGESGAGKSSFVETFVDRWVDGERVLWGACDPLPTPRPLGPIHDVAHKLAPATQAVLAGDRASYDIVDAVYDDLRTVPSVLVLDDLQWADQATIDLLRFVLRRVSQTRSLAVGVVRDDEVGIGHPLRVLLGDAARSPRACSVPLPPLSAEAVARLAGDTDVNSTWLHQITGGNAFFVCEMLEHHRAAGTDLPTTVRDAVLARTADLDPASWDALHLLTCSPGALPDRLLTDLGVTLPALRKLSDAGLIRRSARGVAFRHDLYRMAVSSVIPPGAEAGLHKRLLDAYETTTAVDPAVLTHHALGAGDVERIRRAAYDAGISAARSGAHTQAAEFFTIALDHGGASTPDVEAQVLELLAWEFYLIDKLPDAIASCRRAIRIREKLGESAAVSANHCSLSVYQWYSANRALAEEHALEAMTVLGAASDDADQLVHLGQAFAMQAYLAVQASDLDRAATLIARAREIADRTGDFALTIRVRLIESYGAVLQGDESGRDEILSILHSAPKHIDELYSGGWSNITYFDVEQRRLDVAAELLDVSIPLMLEHDLPICQVWQIGSRARLALMVGEWDDAIADADRVLDAPSAPLARTWPSLIRALVALRRHGTGTPSLDDAWELARRFAEPIRMLPAAAAIVEKAWLTGVHDDRIAECRELLTDGPGAGLDWSRGELAVWLHRIGEPVGANAVAEPYRLVLEGAYEAAADEFHRLSMPYDAALALLDGGDRTLAARALDILDRLGADAVAAKVRRDLRAKGESVVPARRRTATLANPAGLTARQVEVLRLLDDGLTNVELAERLFLSVKTVDHHVSAILAKLEVNKRRDAVRKARQLGILPSAPAEVPL
ncbi:ATP-binding protein [Mycolicibacterium sp. 120270]|uniref:ATP-binding protein n=1 Tax=Mycolicibacterium sp. 120270 TaxID=3090600 RepID=UPI00299F2D5D|nr:AAA family ATPase [Mycolicibacterium sp. 120270]MDX1883089.1 AAA family ATPase [Mycolicibacterium sp. 120270]